MTQQWKFFREIVVCSLLLLWFNDVADWSSTDVKVQSMSKCTSFGGLYQLIAITRQF